jgi:hypothetical protein
MKKFEVTSELIGKYINRCLYSDIEPVGKIVGIKGKTKVLVQPVVAGPNKTKMEWVEGGFAGHCLNQYEQSYDFFEKGEVFEVSMSNSALRNRMWRIHNNPSKYYDFNF